MMYSPKHYILSHLKRVLDNACSWNTHSQHIINGGNIVGFRNPVNVIEVARECIISNTYWIMLRAILMKHGYYMYLLLG
jgi:hypothetical protein